MKSAHKTLDELMADLRGDRYRDEYVGKKLYGRPGTEFENVAGVITNISACTLGGCGGNRLHVKWPDGKRTYPCAKGCFQRDDGDHQIRP